MSYEEIIRETARSRVGQVAQALLADNPLMNRLARSTRDRETRKWLTGDSDVSMGMSWTHGAQDGETRQ